MENKCNQNLSTYLDIKSYGQIVLLTFSNLQTETSLVSDFLQLLLYGIPHAIVYI